MTLKQESSPATGQFTRAATREKVLSGYISRRDTRWLRPLELQLVTKVEWPYITSREQS